MHAAKEEKVDEDGKSPYQETECDAKQETTWNTKLQTERDTMWEIKHNTKQQTYYNVKRYKKHGTNQSLGLLWELFKSLQNNSWYHSSGLRD